MAELFLKPLNLVPISPFGLLLRRSIGLILTILSHTLQAKLMFKLLISVALLAVPLLSANAAMLDDLGGTLLADEPGLLAVLAGLGAMVTIAIRRSR
jgi:hypothetical protein